MNNQPIEKRQTSQLKLSVHSIFYTIQGEGPFCGTPAVFIRLAGCNLQCPLCDTDYTSQRTEMGEFEILFHVNELYRKDKHHRGLVVITGGEPFRQDITDLLKNLVAHDYYVQIETNGTLPPPPDRGIKWGFNTSLRQGVYIVCAPKTGKVNSIIHTLTCAYKYVLKYDQIDTDGLPTYVLDHTANPRVERPVSFAAKPIYVQPADEQDEIKNNLNLKAAIKSCLDNGYFLQLQIHKIIGLD